MTSNDTRRKSLRRLAAGAVAALAVAIPATSTAAEYEPPVDPAVAGPAATSITIEAQQGGFFGYVQSANEDCEYNRTVTLYKVKGSGKKKAVGSDLAQPNGPDSMYSINTTKKGKFVAKVPAMGDCLAATSPIAYAQL